MAIGVYLDIDRQSVIQTSRQTNQILNDFPTILESFKKLEIKQKNNYEKKFP